MVATSTSSAERERKKRETWTAVLERKRVEERKRRKRRRRRETRHESLVVVTYSGEVPDPHRKVPRPAALARQGKTISTQCTTHTHTHTHTHTNDTHAHAHGAHKRGLRRHDKVPDDLAFVELDVCERIVVTCADRDESAKEGEARVGTKTRLVVQSESGQNAPSVCWQTPVSMFQILTV